MDKWQFNELMRKAPNLKIRRPPEQVENPDWRSTSPGGVHSHSGKWNKKNTSYNCSNSREKRFTSTTWWANPRRFGHGPILCNGRLKNPNCHEIKAISKVDTRNEQLYRILHQYQGQFVGIRKAQLDARDIAIHLPLKHETTRVHKDPTFHWW